MVSRELGRGPSRAGAAVAGQGRLEGGCRVPLRPLARCREGAAAALRVPLLAGERLCNSAGLWEAGPCQALGEGQWLPALRTRVGAFSLVPSPPVPSRGAGRAGAAYGAPAAAAALSRRLASEGFGCWCPRVGAIPWQGSSTTAGDACGSGGAARGLSAGRAAARPRAAGAAPVPGPAAGALAQVCCTGGSRTPELGHRRCLVS